MGPNFRTEIIKMILNKWGWLGVGVINSYGSGYEPVTGPRDDKAGNFWSRWATIRFPRRIQLHGINEL